MEIGVDGWRASVSDWDAVRNIPRDQLPPLTPEQREVAKKLGVSEDDYARSALAGKRTQEHLLRKAERLARVMVQTARNSGKPVQVEKVVLRTMNDRFDVDLRANGTGVRIQIPENVVDDYFDSGSEESEQRLKRILERALASTVQ